MKYKPFSPKSDHSTRAIGWKNSTWLRFFLLMLFPVLFYFTIADNFIPHTYDLKQGDTSEKNITATKMVFDAEATEKAKNKAAQDIQPVYAVVSMQNTDLMENIYAKLQQINSDEQVTEDQKVAIYRREIPDLYKDFYANFIKNNSSQYSEPLVAQMKQHLTDQQYRIPEETFFKLPKLTAGQLTEMESTTRVIIARLMSDQWPDVQPARSKVAEQVIASQLTNKIEREVVQELVKFVLTPNKFLDEEATAKARTAAMDNTAPVYINNGDLLVKKGDVITADIYNKLEHLGLLKGKVGYWQELGTVLMVLLFFLVLYMFVRQSRMPVLGNNANLIMLVLIYVLNLAVMKTVTLAQSEQTPFAGYLAPVAMGTVLIAILLDEQQAFISSILFGIFASIVFNQSNNQLFDFQYGFVAVVTGFVSIFAIHRATQRSAILRAGLLISLFSCVAGGSMILLGDHFVPKMILSSLAFAAAGGLLTAILVIGLLPFFEVAFGILSPLKLVELSNPNHPLLRKLLTETPGTYHHSVMVGNLSEAAAESIGANGLLCRVGSFYHDIGKTKRPSYFIENQMNIENPHDKIDPQLSKSIIIAHARDGVEMLKDYKIPKAIRDIAEQHHGTTLLKYFYHKALKMAEEKGQNTAAISEDDYRYSGPKAQTKEAAIVGIADSVEAAVRSMRNPTIEQIDLLVDKIIKSRLDDNQFNECDLTLKELDMIAKILNETLLGIFHSRIEYPEQIQHKREDKGA